MALETALNTATSWQQRQQQQQQQRGGGGPGGGGPPLPAPHQPTSPGGGDEAGGRQRVFAVSFVRGTPFYGYHAGGYIQGAAVGWWDCGCCHPLVLACIARLANAVGVACCAARHRPSPPLACSPAPDARRVPLDQNPAVQPRRRGPGRGAAAGALPPLFATRAGVRADLRR